jgi:hypothetical protein
VAALAGHIAHKYNNALTAIVGNVSLAQSSLNPDDKIYKSLQRALTASRKAQNLSEKLFAYVKGKDCVKRNPPIPRKDRASCKSAATKKAAAAPDCRADTAPALTNDPQGDQCPQKAPQAHGTSELKGGLLLGNDQHKSLADDFINNVLSVISNSDEKSYKTKISESRIFDGASACIY